MDIEPIIDGLQVSGIGMGMTASVLIILALSVRGMAWIDAYLKRREMDVDGPTETEPIVPASPDPEVSTKSQSDGARRAAAIGVALALAQHANMSKDNQQSGERVAHTPPAYDSWLTEGRARQRGRQGVIQGSTGWR